MCFSATASFSVAAVTAAIGLATLRHVTHWKGLPLAAVPLLFAVQQSVEGLIWLQLDGATDSAAVAALSFVFLIFAEVLWPVYAAVAVLLIEPDRRRRLLLIGFAVIGALLSARLFMGLLDTSHVAAIRGHSIDYASTVNPYSWQMIPYLVSTCFVLLVSSHRAVQAFGLVVALGFIVSTYLYLDSFVSVWCFFAAADSTLLYFLFRRSHPRVQRRAS